MEYQKTAEATSDMIGNKIANILRNDSGTVTNEHDIGIPKER